MCWIPQGRCVAARMFVVLTCLAVWRILLNTHGKALPMPRSSAAQAKMLHRSPADHPAVLLQAPEVRADTKRDTMMVLLPQNVTHWHDQHKHAGPSVQGLHAP